MYGNYPYYMPNNGFSGAPSALQQTPTQIIRVTGLDGARAYQMPPNSSAALFDSNDDIFYVKTTDGAGFGSIRAFVFTPKQDASEMPKNAPNDYVTRSEFERLKEEALSYVKQYIRQNDKPADANG